MRNKFLNFVKSKYFPFALFTFVFLSLSIILLVRVFTQSIAYDDAYNISIAKNLASGLSYVSSYDNYIYFNSEVTTGPVMVVPAALLIKLFGNQYWVPQLITYAFFLVGIVAILYTRFIKSRKLYLSLTLFLLLSFLLVPVENFVTFLGEVPSALFIILAAIFLSKFTTKALIVAGILLGLAALIKSIVFLFFPAAIITIIIAARSESNSHKRHLILHKAKLVSIFSASFVITYLAYLILKFLGEKILPSNVMQASESFSEFFLKASGLSKLISTHGINSKLVVIGENIDRSFSTLSTYLRGDIFALIFLLLTLIIAIILSLKIIRSFKVNRINVIMFALVLNTLLHLVWWFTISQDGWLRHIIQILMYMSFIVSVLVFRSWNKRNITQFCCIFFILLTLITRAAITLRDNSELSDTSRLTALLQTAEFLDNFKRDNPDVVLAGCGWWANRDLEYIMKDSLNFKNCYYMQQEYLDNNKVYLVKSDFFNWGNEIFITKFAELCDKEVIYTNNVFTVSRCYKRPV